MEPDHEDNIVININDDDFQQFLIDFLSPKPVSSEIVNKDLKFNKKLSNFKNKNLSSSKAADKLNAGHFHKFKELNKFFDMKNTSITFSHTGLGGHDLDDYISNFTVNTTGVEMSDLIPIERESNNNSESDSYYIPVLTTQGVVKIYIEQKEVYDSSSKQTYNHFQYDFFNTGKIYVNLPKGIYIEGANPVFAKLIRNYFYETSETSNPLSSYPSYNSHQVIFDKTEDGTIAHCVNSVNSNPESICYAYNFDISKFFRLTNAPAFDHLVYFPSEEQTPVKVQIKKTPICSYYSMFTGSEDDVISSDYKFANHLMGVRTCSCPARTPENYNSVLPCEYEISSMPACVFYKPDVKLISKMAISPKNTKSSILFELTYFKDTDKNNVFFIRNITDNVLINNLVYPSDISYEDAVQAANAVFDEYVTCYVDHGINKDYTDTSAASETRVSFIQTLIKD